MMMMTMMMIIIIIIIIIFYARMTVYISHIRKPSTLFFI